MIVLRPYQTKAVDALAAAPGNPLAAMATGTGKSLVIAEYARRRGGRILVLCPRRELIEQDEIAIRHIWPDAPVGVCCAGLGRREIDAQVLIATVHSVYRNPTAIAPRDRIIVDEAHLVPHDDVGMYRGLIADLAPKQVVGLTATPYRLDSGRLDEGDDRMFDRIVYEYGILGGIADGWLAPLITKATSAEIDTRGIHTLGGEFVASKLEERANTERLVEAAVDEIAVVGADRKQWLAFCCGIDHAAHVADVMRRRGIVAVSISGKTASGDRSIAVDAFRRGEVQCLTGCQIFTTGFDVPAIDLIAMLRPTKSPSLYVQMVGRGTRPAPNKRDCLVLDFGGNVRRLGPVDAPMVITARHRDERQEKTGPAAIEMKSCPECRTYMRAPVPVCDQCGHVFEQPPPRKPAHEAHADALPIMSGEMIWIDVNFMTASEHLKAGKTIPTVKISYVGRRPGADRAEVFSEWLALEHAGVGRDIAIRKWHELGGQYPPPRRVIEALRRQSELVPPARIGIVRDGQYWSIRRRAA
jgi:DNA repair protein RadD